MNRRVLVISERFQPESFLINDLVREWVSAGLEVTVLTQIPSYPHDRLFEGFPNRTTIRNEGGVRVVRFKTVLGYKRSLSRKVANYAMFMLRACVYGIREGWGIRRIFVFQTGPLTQALPVPFLKLIGRKRATIWTQDIWPDAVFAYGFADHGALAATLKRFVRWLYGFFDVVIVSSPGFAARLGPYVARPECIKYIPQWVPADFELSRPASFVPDQAVAARFLFAGNIGSMQNLDRLIRAFGMVDDGKTAALYLLGDGSRRDELARLVDREGIKNVHFLGAVTQDKVKSYIDKVDFSVISLSPDPSVGLTIPAKFQAYLSSGKPILAVARGEVESLVQTHELGVWADPTDEARIAETIRSAAASSKATKDRWTSNMKRLLDRDFSKGPTVSRLTQSVLGD